MLIIIVDLIYLIYLKGTIQHSVFHFMIYILSTTSIYLAKRYIFYWVYDDFPSRKKKTTWNWYNWIPRFLQSKRSNQQRKLKRKKCRRKCKSKKEVVASYIVREGSFHDSARQKKDRGAWWACEAASKAYPAGKNGRGPDHLLPLWYRR